ncbi:hypothetical protein HY477_02880 [Candidatus Uhrbacteria bacterium]|nr:hypothetical protein [Candidatus Uhrbacteria bacterium]
MIASILLAIPVELGKVGIHITDRIALACAVRACFTAHPDSVKKSTAAYATQLYATANELSRLDITAEHVAAALEAIADILGNEVTVADVTNSLHSEESETREIVARASALFASDQVAPARVVAG